MQTTSEILMVRPAAFAYNAETAVNNLFQQAPETTANNSIATAALAEFDAMVDVLRKNGVHVTTVQDTYEPHTPDSLFPNNWVSFHADGTLVLYPMFAKNRRLERKPTVMTAIKDRFTVKHTLDFSVYEENERFLEGTGSMVLDRVAKIAYACLSVRTDKGLLKEFCKSMGYRPVAFTSVDQNNSPVYHTNVMMCVGDKFAVVCLDSVPDATEKKHLREQLIATGKTIVPITMDQMGRFAGNMLQVRNTTDEALLVMSSQAYDSLRPEQLEILSGQCRILHSPLTIIETHGGGSARCMMAEVFLAVRG